VVEDREDLSPGVEKGIRRLLRLIRAGEISRVEVLEQPPG
jgi:hypothetical protein